MTNIRGGIKAKLVFVFLLIALIPSALLGALSYLMSKEALSTQMYEDFDAIANGGEKAVVEYLHGAQRALFVYGHAATLVTNLRKINNGDVDAAAARADVRGTGGPGR